MTNYMKRANFLLGATLALGIFSCEEKKPTLQGVPAVYATAETPAVKAGLGDDAADDPAIWINPVDSTKSAIIGTVKHYGLEVYDLQAQLLHSYKTGNPNNVDVRLGFPLANGEKIDLAACSDRSANEVLVFKINPADASLSLISGGRIKSKMGEVYGICLYKNGHTDQFYVFLNGKDGTVEQYELLPFGENEVSAKLVRTLKLASQPEGMVADDYYGVVYFGEEDKGIWRANAAPDSSPIPTLLQKSGMDNPNIAYDIEGLALYMISDSTGYLLASSQGNNSYAVFGRQDGNSYLGSFIIGDGTIDGTYDTDGIEATAANLGGTFSQGIFVAQDGANLDAAGKAQAQNFKLVAGSEVLKIIEGMGR
jgi:3-phytase